MGRRTFKIDISSMTEGEFAYALLGLRSFGVIYGTKTCTAIGTLWGAWYLSKTANGRLYRTYLAAPVTLAAFKKTIDDLYLEAGNNVRKRYWLTSEEAHLVEAYREQKKTDIQP